MQTKLPSYLKLVVILLGIVLAVFVMIVAKSLLVPILISGLLAVLISPFASWLESKKIPSPLASGISLIALLLGIVSLLYFFYFQILGFAKDISVVEDRTTALIENLNSFIKRNFEDAVPISISQIKDITYEYISENVFFLTQNIMARAATFTMVLIIPIYIYLFLYFRRFLASFFMKAFGEANEEKVSNVINNVKHVVKSYISGMLIVICILAVLNTSVLYAFGIEHAILFGVFAAILNIIPYLGPIIGSALPIAFALLTKDSLWYPVGIFISIYIIQLFESYLFTPKIVGSKVSLNPLMTIIALFIGNFIWGLAGMILFIPGMAILKVIFDEIPGMEPYGYLLGNVYAEKKSKRMMALESKIKKVTKNIISKKSKE
jgi:predicted PurR-regulated permease PerM